MIDWLKAGKSAYFYRKRGRLPKTAIGDLFRDVRQDHPSPSNNLFQHIKVSYLNAQWSAISFFYEREPSFLELPPGQQRERICGYLFLIEYRDFIAVFRSGLDLPSTFKTKYLDRAGSERVEKAIATFDATFEKIRLRNMTSSKYALRSKILEANNLESVVGPAGASRFLAQGYRVRRGQDHVSVTPSTGRISLRSDRSAHQDLVRWAISEIDALLNPNPQSSQFIASFARPIDLGSLPNGVITTHVAVNVGSLSDELFESDEPMWLVRKTANGFVVLTKPETDSVLDALSQDFPIVIAKKISHIVDARNNNPIGTIEIGKNRIALRRFDLPEILDISIESATGAPGQQGDCITLKRYIDGEGLFIVLFSEFSLVYIDGTLYRDDVFADGGGSFLKHISANAALDAVTSEKGTFSSTQQAFQPNSVFRAVIDSVSQGDDILICDDMATEWADFIGVNRGTTPKSITFYHAKHNAVASLGASPMHEVVSQAIKNLGKMALTDDAIAARLNRWSNLYVNGGIQTEISRYIRGQAATVRARIGEAHTAPDTIRRAYIVTSALSRQAIKQALADVKAGTAPPPHFVQLYWLLSSYFSACAEVGANGYVVCRT